MPTSSGYKKLERRLGFWSVVAISISAMLGSGIFVLPGIAASEAGSSAWLAYFLSALCVLPAAVSKSELATAMPSSGGTYVYIERTFGPLAGTVAGFGLALSLLLKSAFALVGFGAYLSVLADVPLIPVAMLLLVLIVVLNIFGVVKVSRAIIIIVSLSLAGLTALCIAAGFTFDTEIFRNSQHGGTPGLLSATALVFVSFAGVTKVAAIAGEIKTPEKNLPRGILTSLLIVTIIYCAVNYVLAGNIPLANLEGNLKPIFTLSEQIGGKYLGLAAALLAIVTMASMANAGILAASRFPFVMGREQLLPNFFGKLHKKHLTPVYSILISGVIVGFAIQFFTVHKIAKLASAFMLMIYMFENLAVIILRELRVQWYKPEYKSWAYPWLQLFGIVSGVLLLVTMGFMVIPAISSIAVPGVLIYFFYSHRRINRKGVVGIRGRRAELMTGDEETLETLGFYQTNEFHGEANVVVALYGNERSPDMLVEMGMALGRSGSIEVVRLFEVPEQTDLDDIRQESAGLRSLRRRMEALGEAKESKVEFAPIVSHDILKSVYEISQRFNCQWMVKEWGGKTHGAFTLNNQIGWLRNHLRCNLAVFRDAGVRYIKKIMVVLHLDNDNDFIAETCAHLSKVHSAVVTFVIFIKKDCESYEENHCLRLLDRMHEAYPGTRKRVLRGNKEVQALVAETAEHDLLVLGLHLVESITSSFFGTEYDRVTERSTCSVMSIQKK